MGTVERGKIEVMLSSVFGDQFILRNPHDIPAGGSWEITAEDFPKYEKLAFLIARQRGMVLQQSIALENLLSSIIRVAFFGKSSTEGTVFVNLVLNRLGLRSKYEVFRGLTKTIDVLKINDHRKLLRRIAELIKIRNGFAHGNLVFEGEKAFLRYYQGGDKEDELTKEYFEKCADDFREASTGLQDVLSSMLLKTK